MPKRLARTIRQAPFEIRFDTAFDEVLAACAQSVSNRPSTWINSTIAELYGSLHRLGHAHSVEAWRDGELVGGAIWRLAETGRSSAKACSAGKPMPPRSAWWHLVERLRQRGFVLLDTQFTTEHLKRFGAIDIPRAEYAELLEDALEGPDLPF